LVNSATTRSGWLHKQRQLIAAALLRAISVQGATNTQAAKWLGISPRTMFGWVHCDHPISVEKVLACRQIHDAFRAALCTYEHSHGASPGYVLKKRRGSK
jgi:hypothetical protein